MTMTTNAIHHLITFQAAGQTFGIDIQSMREIIRYQSPTRFPESPECIEGALNLRGTVMPIIDFRQRMNLPPRKPDGASRIIVVQARGWQVGFVVDAVKEILHIPDSDMKSPANLLESPGRDYMVGVAKHGERLLIVVDPDLLLDSLIPNPAKVRNIAQKLLISSRPNMPRLVRPDQGPGKGRRLPKAA